MKKAIFSLFLFVAAAVWAGPSAIDKEIEAIMKAPPEKRVELMNAFKRRLFEMNQQERALAIRRLRGSMRAAAGHPAPQGPPPGMRPGTMREYRPHGPTNGAHAGGGQAAHAGNGAGSVSPAPVPPPSSASPSAGSAPAGEGGHGGGARNPGGGRNPGMAGGGMRRGLGR